MPTEETLNRATVRCGYCERVQYAQANCRRCKKPLPSPTPRVQYVDRVVVHKVVETVYASPIGMAQGVFFGNVLPTWDQLEAAYIREALARCGGSSLKAAALIGMGKTTLFRKLKAMPPTGNFLIPPHVEIGPIDPLMSEDALQSTSVEGMAE